MSESLELGVTQVQTSASSGALRGLIGVIVEIKNIPWGFSHIMKITEIHNNILHQVGDTVELKPEQFTIIS